MAKPKRSMTDVLAEIAAQEASGNMAALQTVPLSRGNVTAGNVARDDGVTSRSVTTPDGFKIRQRIERPHASIYAHPKVFRAIREIAAAEGRKPHDLFTDGLRLMFERYGRDFDKLNRGE